MENTPKSIIPPNGDETDVTGDPEVSSGNGVIVYGPRVDVGADVSRTSHVNAPFAVDSEIATDIRNPTNKIIKNLFIPFIFFHKKRKKTPFLYRLSKNQLIFFLLLPRIL